MAETKKTEVKEEVKSPVKETEEVKKAAAPKKAVAIKKVPVKKTAVKKTADKPVKPVKAAEKAPAKKRVVKATAEKVTEAVHFQFSGKSYTSEDLVKICKDVWKYDLDGKEEDFKSVELYVKPEENTTYYVINGNITGSFFI